MNKKITYLIPLVLITACSGYSNNTKDIQSKQTATTNQDYNIKIDDYTEKHLSVTIELFSHYCKKGKVFYGE